MSDQIYKQAQKRVRQKKGFFKHLAAFIGVGFFFFAMNMYTLLEEGPEVWFFFPLLPWSIGLVIHYLNVFGFPGSGALTPEWEKAQLEKEVNQLRQSMNKRGYSTPKEESLELPELERKKDSDWDKGELV